MIAIPRFDVRRDFALGDVARELRDRALIVRHVERALRRDVDHALPFAGTRAATGVPNSGTPLGPRSDRTALGPPRQS